MEDKIIKAVKECMSDKSAAGQVTLQSNLRDELHYDSLDTMLLITELETIFDMNIDVDDFRDIITVGDIVEKMRGAVNA